jgi:adenylate kinase family enzyme
MAVQIAPLEEVVDHYRAGGILRTVDGSRPIDEVSADVLAVVATRDGAGTRRW